jgi:hypothetical protein
MHGQVLTNQMLKTMKTNKNHRTPTGKHCINLYVDFTNNDAGCFITGRYDVHKTMLIAAAKENPSFSQAFLDAALEYANMLLADEEKGAHHA